MSRNVGDRCSLSKLVTPREYNRKAGTARKEVSGRAICLAGRTPGIRLLDRRPWRERDDNGKDYGRRRTRNANAAPIIRQRDVANSSSETQ